MKKTHVKDDLVAFVSGDCDEGATLRIRRHLASCPACRKEYDAIRSIWAAMGDIPDERPSPSMARTFHAMLNALEKPRAPKRNLLGEWLFGRPALQLALAAVVLAVGIGLGAAWKGSGSEQLGQLREEVSDLRNLLARSLLQQESASERLKGVSWSSGLEAADPGIATALVNVMMHDRNVNVRLAALSALARNMAAPDVRGEILRALPVQKSPLMQLALVDVLVQFNDQESRDVLQRSLQRTDLRPEVRQRIQQGIKLIL